jgi:hypothetical protein
MDRKYAHSEHAIIRILTIPQESDDSVQFDIQEQQQR